MKHKYNVGQKVIYKGAVGTVTRQRTYIDGSLFYVLDTEDNDGLYCTASETDLTPYDGQETDKKK